MNGMEKYLQILEIPFGNFQARQKILLLLPEGVIIKRFLKLLFWVTCIDIMQIHINQMDKIYISLDNTGACCKYVIFD